MEFIVIIQLALIAILSTLMVSLIYMIGYLNGQTKVWKEVDGITKQVVQEISNG
jgi:Na+(H+)/acetate symporter ActP|tara:strand:+ start:167 stop:328 length:162 start_codon:yes stop_codon:yes gene_type:complete